MRNDAAPAPPVAAVATYGLGYRYGRHVALHDVTMAVPPGAIQALLGPNGSGKTTLLQLLAGVRMPDAGRATVLGRDASRLSAEDRRSIAYVGEGQRLPAWMRLEQLEAYLRPFYPGWDHALADALRERFALDPRRKVGTFSRGESMKAALLLALAPRPRVLLMDEPFTGMDVAVKDELVRGLLATAMQDGCTVLVASHDLLELEPLADHVAFIAGGRLRLSESMESLQRRYVHVDVVVAHAEQAERVDAGWLRVERSGRRLSFIVVAPPADFEAAVLPRRFPGAVHIETRPATLLEIFVALARSGAPAPSVTRRLEAVA